MTRIVGGRLGGRRLAVPQSGTRPTSDMAREGLFSTLESLVGGLEGRSFLDLYAGSGAVGLEASSRGAKRVVLVESAPRALRVLRDNIAGVAGDAKQAPVTAVAGKVESVAAHLASSGQLGFDVVFADPPYDLPSKALAAVIETLRASGVLASGAVVAVERASRDAWEWPAGVEALRHRRYGDATIWYGRVRDDGAE